MKAGVNRIRMEPEYTVRINRKADVNTRRTEPENIGLLESIPEDWRRKTLEGWTHHRRNGARIYKKVGVSQNTWEGRSQPKKIPRCKANQ
jgi:hypothetical protein